MSAGVTFRAMRPGDWPAVERIHRAGLDTGNATFDPEPPTWEVFEGARRPDLRLVALDETGTVRGWAAAGAVSPRPVYSGVVDHSLYVDPAARGRGIGGRLLESFVALTERRGVWTIQASLFEENTASLRLHERAGFRVVGRRERIGLMTFGPWEGQWRDTLLLERRARST